MSAKVVFSIALSCGASYQFLIFSLQIRITISLALLRSAIFSIDLVGSNYKSFFKRFIE